MSKLDNLKKEAIKRMGDRPFWGQSLMQVNGLGCEINMPPALKEEINGLPPYGRRKTFVVDEYKECPDNWMNGSDIASSYFVPVLNDYGMWLDFNFCARHKHEVAIVVSIQGVNPVTGQKTDALQLEQYKKNCPVHDVSFAQERFCPECKYKWPAQNYICTTGTPYGQLWLDGFRTPDGKVKQYVFTEEETHGVAANIIGKDRVYAIGVAFYISKKPKPKPIVTRSRRSHLYSLCAGSSFGTESLDGDGKNGGYICTSNDVSISKSMKMEVGAGELINQEVHPDPQDIDYWSEKPAGMIYVNYCSEEQAKQLIAGGKREEVADGFLSGIPKAT